MLVSIGIDQSFTSTAVVVTDAESETLIDFFVIGTAKERDDNLDKIVRARFLTSELTGYIYQMTIDQDVTIDSIKIEGIGFGARGNVTRDLAGLQFLMIDGLMSHFNLEPRLIAPTSLKKFATGKGNASKKEVIEATPEGYKTRFLAKYKKSSLDDFCDAYWLSLMNQVSL